MNTSLKRIAAVTALIVILAGAAMAVPAGMDLVFDKSPMGKVTFSGKIHADAGVVCKDCHNADLFPAMKKGTVEIKMNKIYAGQLCGSCHNGTRAFKAMDNCNRCHKK